MLIKLPQNHGYIKANIVTNCHKIKKEGVYWLVIDYLKGDLVIKWKFPYATEKDCDSELEAFAQRVNESSNLLSAQL